MTRNFCDRCTETELDVNEDNKLRGVIGSTNYTITISCTEKEKEELGPRERIRQPKEKYKMLCKTCKGELLKRVLQNLERTK